MKESGIYAEAPGRRAGGDKQEGAAIGLLTLFGVGGYPTLLHSSHLYR